ncbi:MULTISPECIES: anaerobic sulfatase maturase [Fusobacterium]|uniref:anaerobic sulfatase maturase n=1 Tax=Fusobacterium TaxID=848 RepID=UPI0014773AA2|nr:MULTISPECIES: anaerobic sulfatase maturase [Fusobacterium]NME36745.1 anaerobic sulfatase maturase [Fusobacterium sp. FSA-380-WT-3A]
MLNFMIKPTSFYCNTACKYCFYLEKQDFMTSKDNKRTRVMDIELAKKFIEKRIIESPTEDVYFTWQGGEPLLAGLDFYKKIVSHQINLARIFNKKIHNSIQTNGMLINEQWAKFFKKNEFLIGVSIDGDQEFHNIYRRTADNRGTFREVSRGIRFLEEYKVEYNTLTVVNNFNVKYPLEVYNYLKAIGVRFMQFIPVIETEDVDENYKPAWIDDKNFIAKPTSFSVKPEDYAKFMNTIFDEWIKKDILNISIRMFDSLLSRLGGFEQTLCVFKEACGGNNLALENDGIIYQCDHFVYPEDKFKIGSFKDFSLNEIEAKTKKLSDLKKEISSKCKECKWLELCHGGCPKHRFVNINDNKERISYFCEAYQSIFEHVTPGLNLMIQFKEKEIPWILFPQAITKLNDTNKTTTEK